ncbi:hypothetical protein ACTFIZ_007915 [Dictyostelium cf. discoideum]
MFGLARSSNLVKWSFKGLNINTDSIREVQLSISWFPCVFMYYNLVTCVHGTTCQTRLQVKSIKECSRTNSINYISRITNRFAINETSCSQRKEEKCYQRNKKLFKEVRYQIIDIQLEHQHRYLFHHHFTHSRIDFGPCAVLFIIGSIGALSVYTGSIGAFSVIIVSICSQQIFDT